MEPRLGSIVDVELLHFTVKVNCVPETERHPVGLSLHLVLFLS